MDLYELTEVKIEGAGGGLSWMLELADEKGTELFVEAGEVQANSKLWALVCNGNLYSVQHKSAKTNRHALDKLRLR